jgi:hypothetical protein
LALWYRTEAANKIIMLDPKILKLITCRAVPLNEANVTRRATAAMPIINPIRWEIMFNFSSRGE